MDITIVNEKENPFLKRKEAVLLLNHPNASTPSKAEIITSLASSNSVDESQVVIDYIFTKKGIAESMVKIKILKERPKVVVKQEVKQGGSNEAQASQAA